MYRKFLSVIAFFFATTMAYSQNYVTLHEDCNFTGRSYYLEAGTYNGYQMKIGNDRLSSMQIPTGFKVTIYENDYFKGKSQTFSSNTTCLEAAWNDMASSIVVENIYSQAGYSQNDFVTFYNDTYSKGYSQSLRPGTYTGDQLGLLKNNISSFKINGNLRVKVYINNENLSGYSVTHVTSQNYLPDNQNDKIGSLIIDLNPNVLPGNNNGYGNTNNNFATFYTECSYGGNALRLMPGYYSGEKLGLLKFNISSVQIPSNLTVKAFINNDNLYGQSSILNENITCLDYNLKDKIGSLVVEEKSGYNYNNGGIGNNPSGNESVIIYTDGNYKGQSAYLLPGTYATMAAASGFPDKALSSLQVPAGYRVVLYEYENFGGKSYTVTESKTAFSFSNWNDRASSIKVFRN